MLSDSEFTKKLKTRVGNPALSDSELLEYIDMGKQDVDVENYSDSDYNAQVLDSACLYLIEDNKFPEVKGVTQGGISTSFDSNRERYVERIKARRQASWMSRGNR